MMSFVGWAFLGNGAMVLRNQGTNMILNLFCGTAVNAARGVAQNVNNAVLSFVNNFMQATQPEITKLKASDQLIEMRDLIFRSYRICYFLMLIFSVPLIKNIDYVLAVWLGEVPIYTNVFVVLTLMDSLIAALNNPLLYGILATGQIKTYEIVMSSMCTLTLPLNYFLLNYGVTSEYVYVVLLVLRFFIMILLVWQSKTYGLRCKDFVTHVVTRIAITTILCVVAALAITFTFIRIDILRFLLETGVIVFLNGSLIFLIGFSSTEKRMIISIIKTKLLPKRIKMKYIIGPESQLDDNDNYKYN